MNYKLAKQLKDVGFPQSTNIRSMYVREDEVEMSIGFFKDLNDVCYIQSLEELIEACGHDFVSLHKLTHAREDNWKCDGKKTKSTQWHTIGSTPEIAVANLWLELNKK